MTEPLWTFRTANFDVELFAHEEDAEPSDLMQFDDDIAFASSGDPAAWFCAEVRVTDRTTGRTLGRDYLGGCSYRSFEDFTAGHRDPDPMNRNCSAMRAVRGANAVLCHYFPDMVRVVCREAREHLSRYPRVRAA